MELTVIEANMSWDIPRNVDVQAYGNWAKRIVGAMVKVPGMVEIRIHRNVPASPTVRASMAWRSLADWANFAESEAWQSLEVECVPLPFMSRLRCGGHRH
jgi:hypothetical protein